MANDLKMVRIQPRLDALFNGKIDLSDAKNEQEKKDKFCTRALASLGLMMQLEIDSDSAASSITDGYHDLGIDAIYNDTTRKKLVLVQSKWRKNGCGGISKDEVDTFVDGVKRVIQWELDGCNDKIEHKKQEIHDALQDIEYKIEMLYCHTGNAVVSQFAFRRVRELLDYVNESGSEPLLSWQEITKQDVYDYLANGQNADEICLDNVWLNNWGSIEEPLKAYYGNIPVKAVGEWYAQYGNRLFAKNIRYYKGSTEVNQGIQEVLEKEPQNFFYYNNGIKMLCKRVIKKAAYSAGRDMGLFALEGVSLVNGAQTTGVIGTVFAENPDILENAKVFIQIVDLGNTDENQAAQITKLSNTQNKIEGKDFAALDPNQERLKKEFAFADIQYLYKTGSRIEDPSYQISLDEAIIAQACMQDDISIVALVKRQIGALTENIGKNPYKMLFNDATNSFSVHNAIQTLRAVNKCIAENEHGVSGRKRLVLVHGNRFLLHLILNQMKGTPEFSTTYIPYTTIMSQVEQVFVGIWEDVYARMEEELPDAYPSSIFQNVGRLSKLI